MEAVVWVDIVDIYDYTPNLLCSNVIRQSVNF
jgi:hypothetical protein